MVTHGVCFGHMLGLYRADVMVMVGVTDPDTELVKRS